MPLDAVPTSSADDFSLMERIAVGDPKALAELYARHAGLVFSLGLRVLSDRADAEELLIDVFWEVWEKSARYDASRGSPVTYLSTLTRSRAIDRVRQRPRGKRMNLDQITAGRESVELSPSAHALQDESAFEIRRVLNDLEANQRQAIECAFFEGLSHNEIAEKLGKPLGTVKTYIRQGLIRLREALRITKESGLSEDLTDGRKGRSRDV